MFKVAQASSSSSVNIFKNLGPGLLPEKFRCLLAPVLRTRHLSSDSLLLDFMMVRCSVFWIKVCNLHSSHYRSALYYVLLLQKKQKLESYLIAIEMGSFFLFREKEKETLIKNPVIIFLKMISGCGILQEGLRINRLVIQASLRCFFDMA